MHITKNSSAQFCFALLNEPGQFYSIQLQRYGLDEWGILICFPKDVRFFNAQTGFGIYQASYAVVSYQGHFSGDMQPEREASHTHPSNVKVKNERSYTSTSQHAFMVCTGKILASISQYLNTNYTKQGWDTYAH
jgi:hypothetical protein